MAVQGRVRLGALWACPWWPGHAGGWRRRRRAQPEHAKKLSGSGSFIKGQLGLGIEAGAYTVGSACRPSVPPLADRQPSAERLPELPFNYLSGPHGARGQRLPAADDARAAREMGETLLSVSLDNYRQLRAVGSYTGTVRTGEFQFSHFLSPDLYWFANFASAYAGLPTYNQLLGGLGWCWRVAPSWRLYAQLGVGSGGYAPEQIDTGPGLLVYPKLLAEYSLTKDLGLAVTAGYLTAPKGSSRNRPTASR